MVINLIKKDYKQTEVGVIPNDWQVTTFNDLFSFLSTGNNTRRELSTEDGNVNYIHYGDIHKNWELILDCNEAKIPFISKEKVRKLPFVQDGDLILADASEDYEGIGASVEVKNVGDKKIVSGLHTLLLRGDKTKIVDGYKAYLTSIFSVKKALITIATGISVYGISKNTIKKIKLPLPVDLKEQSAIVEVLSTIESLIKSLDELIEKKKNIKRGAIQELLTGKKRLSDFKGEFETKKLDEVATIFRGASPRPIADPKWFDENSDIGWVRISDVTKSNKYLFDTSQNLSENGVKNSRFVNPNNLIMSICATIGRPIITMKKVCIHDGFVVFEKPAVNIEYLYYYLASIEQKWSSHGQTGSQMNLNTTIIGNEKVTFPPTEEEQSAIVQILSNMDSEIGMLKQKRDKYRQLKVGMMQQLLSGRIRLKWKS